MSESEVKVGDRLDKYLLAEKLGEGGMGVVFAGVHEGLGREVAIKLLRSQFAKNEELMKRFQREAESVSRIGHPNIVAVYDFGRTADGSLYYVMERIRGDTLRGRLQRGPAFTDEELVAIFGAMCRALAAAHARGIVHRDLKPDNVLLQAQKDAPPHVKIVDFGVAKVLETERSAGLTSAGSLIGTPTYMAPEQIAAAQGVDGRADIYSLGAMLYVCVVGRPPFVGDPMAVLIGHIREEVPRPSTMQCIRACSPQLEAMILRALSKDPEGRPKDALAFLAELETAVGRSTATPRAPAAYAATMAIEAPVLTPAPVTAAPAPTPAPTVPAPKGGAPRGLLIGAALVLIGGVAAGLMHLRAPSEPTPKPAAITPPTVATPPPSGAIERAAALVRAALDGQAQDRRAVLDALAEIGDPRALPMVLRGLSDDNPEVRRAAAVAAAAIGQPSDKALVEALAEAAGRSGGAVAVEIAAARFRLGQIAEPSVTQLLTRALDAPDGALRLRAAVALADKKLVTPTRLRATVAAAPATVRRSLRWAAYIELKRLGDPAFDAELTKALTGNDLVAKLDAAMALAKLGDERAKAALADVAQRSTDVGDRADARAVLAELGDAAAFDALLAAVRASGSVERARAVLALARLARSGGRHAAVVAALAPLVDDLNRAPRLHAAAALSVLAPSMPSGGPSEGSK